MFDEQNSLVPRNIRRPQFLNGNHFFIALLLLCSVLHLFCLLLFYLQISQPPQIKVISDRLNVIIGVACIMLQNIVDVDFLFV